MADDTQEPDLRRFAAPAASYSLQRGSIEGADCAECPFAKDGKPNRPVPGEGPANPAWIAIGEGPGFTEVSMGRPFIGASGQMLNKGLEKIKRARSQIWVDNVTLCRPTGEFLGDRKKAAECCRPRLRRQLAKLPRVPILALGAVAAQAFIGDDFKITEMAGAYYEVSLDKTNQAKHVIIPTLHPAAILRGGSGLGGAHSPDIAFWNLVYDIGKVDAIANGRDIRFRENDIVIEESNTRRATRLIEQIIESAYEYGFIAVDTETYVDDDKRHSALQPLVAKLRALGLATPKFAVSLSWSAVTVRARRLVALAFADPRLTVVMHNQLYDRPVLRRHGMEVVTKSDDTMLMHHSAFPGLSHNLQRVGTQYFAISPWKAEYRAGDDSRHELLTYNAKDTLVTARLRAPLQIAIKKTNSEKTYEIDLKMAEYAERMHEVGIPVSREVNQQLLERFTAACRNAKQIIDGAANNPEIRDRLWEWLAREQAKTRRRPKQEAKWDPDDYTARVNVRLNEIQKKADKGKWAWNLRSSAHLVAYLRARGIPLYLQTATGKTAATKEILEQFVHFPEVAALIDYRENEKMLSTFCWRMFDRFRYDGKIIKYGFADGNDRIHPRWSVHKITGRWGAEAPVIMNVPKADKKRGRPNLRTQFVPRKGRKFVGFDLAQLEARLIALLSGDKFLLDIFRHPPTTFGPGDIHTAFASVIWPNFHSLPVDQKKKLRDAVKRPEYGAFYGGSVETLWKNIKKDFPEVKIEDIARMVQLMQAATPGVTIWHNELMRDVQKPPYEIRSAIYGRRRCFPLGNADINEVYNHPVQSSGADIMDTCLIRIMPRLAKYREAYAIMQIHDAAVFECWEDDAEALLQDIIEAGTQEHSYRGNTVAFPVDAKIGDSWAEV